MIDYSVLDVKYPSPSTLRRFINELKKGALAEFADWNIERACPFCSFDEQKQQGKFLH